jgi:hypothetical protein
VARTSPVGPKPPLPGLSGKLSSVLSAINLFKYTYFSKTSFSHEIIETLKPDYIFEFRVERFLN